MSNLFDHMDADQRRELSELGWVRADTFGIRRWQSPTGETLDEDEAFRWLERHKRALGRLGDSVSTRRPL